MTDDLTQWDPFVDELCAALGLRRDDVDVAGVLDLARDVAQAAPRPMAPVSAYLAGVAVARGRGTSAEVADLIRDTLGPDAGDSGQ